MGFEPTRRFYTSNILAGCRFRPTQPHFLITLSTLLIVEAVLSLLLSRMQTFCYVVSLLRILIGGGGRSRTGAPFGIAYEAIEENHTFFPAI